MVQWACTDLFLFSAWFGEKEHKIIMKVGSQYWLFGVMISNIKTDLFLKTVDFKDIMIMTATHQFW